MTLHGAGTKGCVGDRGDWANAERSAKMARAAEERIEIVERCSAAPRKVYKPNSIDVEAFRNLERINCPKRCDRGRSRE